MDMIPVVLCGGAGARLWPLSRKNHPKPFIPLFADGATLFRRAMERIAHLGCTRTVVVCNHAHRFLVAEGLSDSERAACTVLVEPVARGTAAAAALAAWEVREGGEDPLLLIMPADHVITDLAAYRAAVEAAAVAARQDRIVVFGIPPGSPDSGYGYIRTDPAQAVAAAAVAVTEFREKPPRDLAERWIAAGHCHWNSGIFLCKASVYLDALARFEPAMAEACRAAHAGRHRDLGFIHADATHFKRSDTQSIDHGILERATDLALVPAAMGWSDLGSWDAIDTALTAQGDNRVRGDVVAQEARGNIVYGGDRLVGLVGVEDCIVVDTPDALLVAARQQSGRIKELVDTLRALGRPEADDPRRVHRPWGHYETLIRGANFQVKAITVHPGQSLSLQLHHHRAEHWVVVSGRARVTRGEEVFPLEENQSTYLPIRTRHRLENPTEAPLSLIEVQCGDYLGEDDIVRFDDRYGRTREG